MITLPIILPAWSRHSLAPTFLFYFWKAAIARTAVRMIGNVIMLQSPFFFNFLISSFHSCVCNLRHLPSWDIWSRDVGTLKPLLRCVLVSFWRCKVTATFKIVQVFLPVFVKNMRFCWPMSRFVCEHSTKNRVFGCFRRFWRRRKNGVDLVGFAHAMGV